jgi:ABC-type lipoprotein export system ATPase subunit/GNAT superfamily N-acetyltransferase
MSRVDIVVETPAAASGRARQLEAIFDVPRADVSRVEWHGDVDFDEKPWHIGLIVGPSGAGKSTLLRNVFGDVKQLAWSDTGVIDDFADILTLDEIADACAGVGFNTIPAWLRPYAVLSTGERFRVEVARRILETEGIVLIDEFTSVVDRQVAKITCHAVQKRIRKNGRKLVVASCHYDIIEWLQPDWIFEPATMTMTWRSLQPRPRIAATIARVEWSTWNLFARYHYMSAELHRAAQCFAMMVDGRPITFAAMLFRPHPKVRDIWGLSRLVTLPDWQGLGAAMILSDALGSAYAAGGKRFHTYPAHPSLIRAYDKSPHYAMRAKPASSIGAPNNKSRRDPNRTVVVGRFGARPCAVFEYVGPKMNAADARALLQ